MSDIITIGAGVASCIAALVAFLSAANTERLRAKFNSESQQLTAELNKDIEAIRQDSDKLKIIYGVHADKEYKLYENIYPKLVKTYNIFIDTKSLNSELDPNEMISTKDSQNERKNRLEKALKQLNFIGDIQVKKPFIDHDIYLKIEKFWNMGFETYLVRNYPTLYSKPFKSDEREYSNEELNEQLNTICKAIKKRLRVVDT